MLMVITGWKLGREPSAFRSASIRSRSNVGGHRVQYQIAGAPIVLVREFALSIEGAQIEVRTLVQGRKRHPIGRLASIGRGAIVRAVSQNSYNSSSEHH